ncbi:MAG: penicillin-binding protein 2 [Thermodesulfobacteriota bacterium]
MNGYFKDKEPRELKARLPFLYIAMGVSIFVLLVRFWQIQVMDADYYRGLSQSNRLRLVRTAAPRGLIYDRSGNRLVENRPGFDLLLVPEDVKDWDKTKERLTKLVGITPEEIDEKVRKAKRRPPYRPVRLKEDMTWEDTAKVESFKFEIPGINIDVSPKRLYLYGVATAHLMGYLGEINERELRAASSGAVHRAGDAIGKLAIEKALDGYLRGVDGGKQVEVDALGRRIGVANSSPPRPGNNVKLSLDLKAQLAAWDAMKNHVGAVVAIEPSTGRVLAMVSTPSFDPNLLSSGISRRQWEELLRNPLDILTNRATQGQYPPASTIKPIVAAAALEEKEISQWTKVFSGPAFNFAGRAYRDWKEAGHGEINVHEAIVESSDTFFYQVGLRLGVDRLAGYAKSFGFGSRTGIGLINEKPGLIPTSEWKKKTYGERWYDGETISVSVGQGYMLATPLQLAMAYAAIANGGVVYKPQLIEEISTPSGELITAFPPEKKGDLKVSPATLLSIRKALVGVVHEKHGTATVLRRSPFKIAGKTGTAQVRRLLERVEDIEEIPYEYRDHAWFAGYAPYDDPKIAVTVIVEHGGFGARTAAPIARKIIETYLAGLPEAPGGAQAARAEGDRGAGAPEVTS